MGICSLRDDGFLPQKHFSLVDCEIQSAGINGLNACFWLLTTTTAYKHSHHIKAFISSEREDAFTYVYENITQRQRICFLLAKNSSVQTQSYLSNQNIHQLTKAVYCRKVLFTAGKVPEPAPAKWKQIVTLIYTHFLSVRFTSSFQVLLYRNDKRQQRSGKFAAVVSRLGSKHVVYKELLLWMFSSKKS